MRISLAALFVLSITLTSASASADAPTTVATADPSPSRPPKPALEATADSLLSAGASTWRGDALAQSSLRLGVRIHDLLGLQLQSRAGYGGVNDRALIAVAFGAQVWGRLGPVRPYARASLVHQHEEPLDSVRARPLEAIVGVGEGIRHRAGAEGAVGLEYTFLREKNFELTAAVDVAAPYFPDERGPAFYVLGGVGFGLHHSL